MDNQIRQKITEEIDKHCQQEIEAIADFCKHTQSKRHLSMSSLGKAIAKKFDLTETAGIKLANGWNRYMIEGN